MKLDGFKRILFLCIGIQLCGCQSKIANFQQQQISNSPYRNDSLALIARLIQQAGNDYFFDDESVCNQEIKYLGEIFDNRGAKFKILTVTTEWGESCRVTKRILVYSEQEIYLGNYYSEILPTALTNNKLVFEDEVSCSFSNGIPDSLLVMENFWVKFER